MKDLEMSEIQEVNGGIPPLAIIEVTAIVDAALIGVMVGMQQEMARQ